MNINYDWTTQAHEHVIHGNVVIVVQLIDNTRTGKRKSGKEVYERKESKKKKQAKKRKLTGGKKPRLLSSGSDNDSNDDDSSEGDDDLVVVPKKKRKARGKKAKAANANKVVSLDTSPGNMFFSLFWTVGKGCTNSGY